jgi:hypothetical protein
VSNDKKPTIVGVCMAQDARGPVAMTPLHEGRIPMTMTPVGNTFEKGRNTAQMVPVHVQPITPAQTTVRPQSTAPTVNPTKK